MRGAGERRRLDAERDIGLAYATAQFTRAKKLEPLARYLPVNPRRQTGPRPKLLDQVRAIARRTGGLIEDMSDAPVGAEP
ncbi:hypothetical protein [Sphingomonas sp. Marseille-Q8236]